MPKMFDTLLVAVKFQHAYVNKTEMLPQWIYLILQPGQVFFDNIDKHEF